MECGRNEVKVQINGLISSFSTVAVKVGRKKCNQKYVISLQISKC